MCMVAAKKNLESLNGGLANWGFKVLVSAIACDCRRFVTKVPLRKGPEKATKAHNCRRLCATCREWP